MSLRFLDKLLKNLEFTSKYLFRVFLIKIFHEGHQAMELLDMFL
jgi:hypothetical protein